MHTETASHSELSFVNCQTSSGLVFEKNQASPTILLVDDCLDCRKSTCLMLQLLPCKIATVLNAEAGLEYLENHLRNIILILLDIDLPGISGLDFLCKIKKEDHLKNVPVILQSSCGIIEERRGLELGADAFIRKPYTRKDLYTALGELELFDPKILAK